VQARALHASFRCIAFDMPGHGESSSVRPPPGYTPEHLTDLVYAKIQALGLEGAGGRGREGERGNTGAGRARVCVCVGVRVH
jgi:hypothetical protein